MSVSLREMAPSQCTGSWGANGVLHLVSRKEKVRLRDGEITQVPGLGRIQEESPDSSPVGSDRMQP